MSAPMNIYAMDSEVSYLEEAFNPDFTFSIKPNPSSNFLNVLIENSVRGDYKIEVYDVLGKMIFNQSLSKMQTSISVSNWKAGIYLVKISNENHSQTKRFIKQ
jgi:hypothetical protein